MPAEGLFNSRASIIPKKSALRCSIYSLQVFILGSASSYPPVVQHILSGFLIYLAFFLGSEAWVGQAKNRNRVGCLLLGRKPYDWTRNAFYDAVERIWG